MNPLILAAGPGEATALAALIGGFRDHLGRGIGRSLLRHALERAAARGALRFCLNTNEKNEAAQSLYRSEGLAPQSHALYPGGREVLWIKDLAATP